MTSAGERIALLSCCWEGLLVLLLLRSLLAARTICMRALAAALVLKCLHFMQHHPIQ